jgi:hypothetical protein
MRKAIKKEDLYRQIAAKHTPHWVRAIPVVDDGDGHRGLANPHEEDDEGYLTMEVPEPNTIGGLWVYLHECAHMRLHPNLAAEGNNYSRGEAEASLEVIRILDEEGITAPLDVLVLELGAFLAQVQVDDLDWERHPTCTKCLEEFDRRIKIQEAAAN